MSSAPRCRYIKVNGTQCGSPALRSKSFCFYHERHPTLEVECYSDIQYATGSFNFPPFEDAHSIQSVLRQVVQMVLQKRLEQKTASLVLYALQIASSNLKRMEQEKPQPEQVVTDSELDTWDRPIAIVAETVKKSSPTTQPDSAATQPDDSPKAGAREEENYQSEQRKNNNKEAKNDEAKNDENRNDENMSKDNGGDYPIATIQACSDPLPYQRNPRVSRRIGVTTEVVH